MGSDRSTPSVYGNDVKPWDYLPRRGFFVETGANEARISDAPRATGRLRHGSFIPRQRHRPDRAGEPPASRTAAR